MGPKYIGLFRVVLQVGRVTYRLELTDELSQIHSMLHVSQPQVCLVDDFAVVPLEDTLVDERLNYIERPVAILDRKMKTLQKRKWVWSGCKALPEGFRVHMGTQAKDERALSRVTCSKGLHGRSLTQVGESYNTRFRYELIHYIFKSSFSVAMSCWSLTTACRYF